MKYIFFNLIYFLFTDAQQQSVGQQQNSRRRDKHTEQRYTFQLRQPDGGRHGPDARPPAPAPLRAPDPSRARRRLARPALQPRLALTTNSRSR